MVISLNYMVIAGVTDEHFQLLFKKEDKLTSFSHLVLLLKSRCRRIYLRTFIVTGVTNITDFYIFRTLSSLGRVHSLGEK